MKSKTYAEIKGWATFQHYRDRNPPWIKLHRSLLNDYEFSNLPLASKALAPLLWLLASETKDGVIRIDSDVLAFRLHFTKQDISEGLKNLLENGFLVNASKPLADCLPDAIPEREGETESEGETDAAIDAFKRVATKHNLPIPREITRKRKQAIKSRLVDHSLEEWNEALKNVTNSDFLRGDSKPSNGHKPFKLNLDWFVNPNNFIKILEGNYNDGADDGIGERIR